MTSENPLLELLKMRLLQWQQVNKIPKNQLKLLTTYLFDTLDKYASPQDFLADMYKVMEKVMEEKFDHQYYNEANAKFAKPYIDLFLREKKPIRIQSDKLNYTAKTLRQKLYYGWRYLSERLEELNYKNIHIAVITQGKMVKIMEDISVQEKMIQLAQEQEEKAISKEVVKKAKQDGLLGVVGVDIVSPQPVVAVVQPGPMDAIMEFFNEAKPGDIYKKTDLELTLEQVESIMDSVYSEPDKWIFGESPSTKSVHIIRIA